MYDQSPPNRFILYSGSIASLALLIVLIVGIIDGSSDGISAIEPEPECIESCVQDTKITTSPFDKLALEAKSVVVWDVKKQQALYAQDERLQLPLASLTKIMTAIVAHERLPENLIVSIEAPYLKTESDSGLLVQEKWRLNDLIDFTLMESSNDGATALAAVAGAFGQQDGHDVEEDDYNESIRLFTAAMNERARELGLTQTFFTNGTGLDLSNNTAGSYGSAYDVARLFEYVVSNIPETFEATREEVATFTSASGFIHRASNTNEAINSIPGFIAGKTGYTDLAGGNLVTAFDAGPDYPIVVVVLGSTIDGRFGDTEKLVWATLEYLKEIY